MARRKGERIQKQIERRLGKRLDALYAWCDERAGRDGYACGSRHLASEYWARFYFKDPEVGAAFQCAIDGRL
jgi:hypothetical protein